MHDLFIVVFPFAQDYLDDFHSQDASILSQGSNYNNECYRPILDYNHPVNQLYWSPR